MCEETKIVIRIDGRDYLTLKVCDKVDFEYVHSMLKIRENDVSRVVSLTLPQSHTLEVSVVRTKG